MTDTGKKALEELMAGLDGMKQILDEQMARNVLRPPKRRALNTSEERVNETEKNEHEVGR